MVMSNDQIERIKKLNLIVDIQPQFIESDKGFINNRLGRNVDKAFNFSKLYKTGIPLFISSDAPVEDPDWIRDLIRLDKLEYPTVILCIKLLMPQNLLIILIEAAQFLNRL